MHHGSQKQKKTAFGCIAKRRDGNVIGVKAGLLDLSNSILHAESKALLQTLVWAETKNWTDCSFIFDNCHLLSCLKKGSTVYNEGYACITECTWKLLRNSRWRVMSVPRENILTADKLARKAIMENLSAFESTNIPFDCLSV